jgi:hypothetical protein
MIIMSSSLQAVDRTLAPYIQQIPFPAPDTETIRKIFCLYLHWLNRDKDESAADILDWVVVAFKELGLSFGELRAIYQEAMAQPVREKRPLTLKDMVRAYTAQTARPDEWDLVTDESLYGDDQTEGESATPAFAQHLVGLFGPLAGIPSDGRLELAFSASYYRGILPQFVSALSWSHGNFCQELAQLGNVKIVDWGWPKGLWAATEGCVYRLTEDDPEDSEEEEDEPEVVEVEESDTTVPVPSKPQVTPQQRWKEAGFTFGLRGLEHDAGQCAGTFGKPWRRLVWVFLNFTMAQCPVAPIPTRMGKITADG